MEKKVQMGAKSQCFLEGLAEAREMPPSLLGQSCEKYLWNSIYVCNLDHDWTDGGPLESRKKPLGKALRK